MNPVCCGSQHGACIDDDGTVWVFGSNGSHQLGLEIMSSVIPTQLQTEQPIISISCGSKFTAFIDCMGQVWCCGDIRTNGTGYTYNYKTTESKTTFKKPNKLSFPPMESIFCGTNFIICIDYEKSIWGLGENSKGQLGLFSTASYFQEAQKIPIDEQIIHVSCGLGFSMILTTEGKCMSSGCNTYGQLGFPTETNFISNFTEIPGLNDLCSVACGDDHCLFLDNEGQVFSVGGNGNGQLGLNNNWNQNTPKRILLDKNIIKIACGSVHSCCIDNTDRLFVFGFNGDGRLGIDGGSKSFPTQTTLTDVSTVSQGGNRIIVQAEGYLWFSIDGVRTKGYGLLKAFVQQNPEYSNIIRQSFKKGAKSARK